mmetsp:Transcript_44541/g.104556  ORF Transcript_44541/g.104556 Transcript_44541/m.104556 type:complete len:403 (-) Transcript_44541:1288-2496(-)
MAREKRPIPQMPAAAHHREVHAGPAALHFDGQDVHITVAAGGAALLDDLLLQHLGQGLDLVAHLGRQLVVLAVGEGHHLLLQRRHDLVGLAAKKALGAGHVAGVVPRLAGRHAGPGAALDLVQQAGTAAVVEDAVLAGAQLEDLLHQLDGFLHRPGAGKGAEVLMAPIHRAAVVAHPREGVVAELQIRVALVVPEQDVEARVQRLDQVVLKQQRLGLGAHHRRLQPGNARDHHADARASMVLLEVAGHATLQVLGLANVKHLVLGIEVAIHARQRRQRIDLRHQALTGHARGGLDLGGALALGGLDCGALRRPLGQLLLTKAGIGWGRTRHGARFWTGTAPRESQHALGPLLPRHRQPWRPRRVLAAGARPGRARPHSAALGGRCVSAELDGHTAAAGHRAA